MNDSYEKLDSFTAAILSDAGAEAEKILKETEEKRKALLEEAEDKYLTEAYRYIRQEVARIKTQEGQRVSHKMLDNKRALHARRDEIACEVFQRVYTKVEVFTQTQAYTEQLVNVLGDALNTFGNTDVIVYLREADLHLSSQLKASYPNVRIIIKQGSFTRGGISIDCPDKKMHIDETYDTRLQDLSEHFAELIGLSLVK